MKWFFLLVTSAVVASWVYYQLTHFASRVAQAIYQTYHAVFSADQTDPPFHIKQEQCSLRPMKCGRFLTYFIAFTLLFYACDRLFGDLYKGIYFGLYLGVLFCIATLDWHYHLISPQCCQGLFALGLGGSLLGVNPLYLEESVQSAAIGFITFYLLYEVAKWHYQKEALGRGDYWLMLGLGSVIHWQDFPLLLFVACLVGLVYVGWRNARGEKRTEVPFGSFLCLSGGMLWLLRAVHA